jgi:hypothetical protein
VPDCNKSATFDAKAATPTASDRSLESERAFVRSFARLQMTADDHTSHAADLAERLVDEVAQPHQRWSLIRALALELAWLANEAGGREADEPDR